MTDSDTVDTYQSVAEEYRHQNRDRSVVEHLVERFLTALEDVTDERPARVANVGCGPGWESATFAAAGHDVVAVDLTPAFLRLAWEEAPDADVARMDMWTLGLANDRFDGLWVCASFIHVPREDAPETLAEFHRVLRGGGVLLFSVQVGTGERVGGPYDGDTRRFTLYRPDELRELIETVGFEVQSLAVDDERWVRLVARA
ncbi:Methyltransferase domain-containing protein [Halogranum amylolyticum]|uniref:Methyltransferase domain-containing protein n=1 Tax=Halogranum amylolyticum TaxID=660520 RepID=A0A1H8PYV0_9EURY|nr:class I SAM-dependent methyltransferase [Halogranum amylolyticum]SEO46918.1 Methyltransferase domain-containing protein [Halogranum amylolyticum]